MAKERLTAIAAQARNLASTVVGKPPGLLVPWLKELRGLMEMYFPDGKLTPELRDAIADAEQMGAFIHDSEWIARRTSHLTPSLAPNMRDRLNRVAATIEGASQSPSSPVPEPQQVNLSQVERVGPWMLIGGRLGRGGQGDVTLVRHALTLERGALKQMTGKRALTEKGHQRFLREIEAFQRIEHPFVVKILDAADSTEPYLVTEVADFGSLNDNRDAFNGDVWRSLRTMRSIALGLGAAHAANIIHRDIKPKNILLQSLDHPLVADFGIAHFADMDTLTSLGSNPGAFKFAPEEYEFEEDPTPAFDVFSLGAVLHFAITGEEQKRPYRSLDRLPPIGTGKDAARLAPIDELIAHLTKRAKEARPQTMTEVVIAIDNVADKLFGRPSGGEMACSCEAGTYRDIGAVKLGSGTEVTIYPDGAGNHGAIGLAQLSPRLEMCSSCGALRLRARDLKAARE